MASTIPYKRSLNTSQLEAVFYNENPLLVLAGAGSGKTRVITYKIAYLVHECGFNPYNLLAVTFTNKASTEMKERISALLVRESDIWIKTFHAAAAKILRLMGDQLGIHPHFSIIDQQDQQSMVKKILKDLKKDPETYNPGKYVHLINRAKDRLLNAEETLIEQFSSDPLFYDIYRFYEAVLSRENLMDFGDLIFKLSRGLARNSEVLERLRNRFRYILVDEFQDTNHAQYELIKQLTLKEGNICVVGDDDQSIYGFRGARVENIMEFPRDFENVKIIRLEENYRSFQTILTASSHLISNNPGRLGKTLYTNKGEGELLQFYRTYSDYDEARYIAGEIQNLVHTQEYLYRDIAIFYRMNAQSRVFESVFSQEYIPYTILGGLRFYEREEIKDILSYLKLMINPMDEISLRRVVNKPPRGIGLKTVESLVKTTIARGYPVYRAGEDLNVPASRLRLVKEFTAFLNEFRNQLYTEYPPRLLKNLYDVSGYLEWLEGKNKDEKVKNLNELYNAVEEFSKMHPSSPIAEFVEEVSLNQGIRDEEFKNNSVFLITLHNAKGLEFPVVFMAGMEEGVFPHFLSGERFDDIQEERRLCYVGMTRAMEKLFLTAAKERKLYGKTIKRDVSHFIKEIPGELMHCREAPDFSLLDSTSRAGDDGEFFYDRRLRKDFVSFFPSTNKTKTMSASTHLHPENAMADFTTGTRVIHKQYGRGRITNVQKGIAMIEFDDGTIMKFMLQYTPLKKE